MGKGKALSVISHSSHHLLKQETGKCQNSKANLKAKMESLEQ